jgi:hypothetical protein
MVKNEKKQKFEFNISKEIGEILEIYENYFDDKQFKILLNEIVKHEFMEMKIGLNFMI